MREGCNVNMKTLGLVAVVFVAVGALACTTETTVMTRGLESTGVSVGGTGSVFGEPDIALVTLGVEAEADTVGKARSEAAETMDAMLEALKSGGVADEDIQTAHFSVQPQFDFVDGRQELRGFSVSNIVTVKVRNIDDTGSLLDDAIEAGGDLARVDSLRFTIDDPSALEDEARRLAMAEAKAKAETLAEAGGVSLGSPLSISEGGGVVPLPFAGADFALADEAARSPIEVGQLEVLVNVQVVYELG